MAARYREIRRYATPSLDAQTVAAAGASIGLAVVSVEETSVILKSRLNLWIFGENIEVAITRVGEHTVIDVTSRSALRTQVGDWGKNRRHVRRLFLAVDRVLGLSVPFEPVLRCGKCDYVLMGEVSGACPECGADVATHAIAHDKPAHFLRLGVSLILPLTAAEAFVLYLIYRGLRIPLGLSFGAWMTIIVVGAFLIDMLFVLLMIALERLRRRFSNE